MLNVTKDQSTFFGEGSHISLAGLKLITDEAELELLTILHLFPEYRHAPPSLVSALFSTKPVFHAL